MIVKTKEIHEIDFKTLTEYILKTIGDSSHLKVQKLLYFIQGFHLAYFDQQLIGNEFEAWVHGPVVTELYHLVKDKTTLHGELKYKQLEEEDSIDDRIKHSLSHDQIALIDEVLEVYGKYDGIELEAITHKQSPWINARDGFSDTARCNETISKESMKDFFKVLLYA